MIFAFVASFVVVRKIIFSSGRTLKIAVAFYNNLIGCRVCFCQSNVKNIRSSFGIKKKKTLYFSVLNLFYLKLGRKGSFLKFIFFFAAD